MDGVCIGYWWSLEFDTIPKCEEIDEKIDIQVYLDKPIIQKYYCMCTCEDKNIKQQQDK